MRKRLAAITAAALLASCGGGNPLSNPDSISNPGQTSGQKLSFIYFQRCINPIYLLQLQVNQNGVVTTNTCASGGCHDTNTGTGGALRPGADRHRGGPANPANTPEVVRATDMYKNFYSSQGATVIGAPSESRLLAKPLLTVLHGGGQIFFNLNDVNAKRIAYWISRPMPQGQDEFSIAGNSMLDPATGACLDQ
ncbi:hypothetical protein FSC37_00210 [Piscinibacter aquaticus]|uniref:Uncharacterized protein n=1 Tax=Piscinibacter aquaticus TaxID=392597 RepID=A0A5C6TXE8_9BURK|nr:hypothetical protein FSC37_00210 [Piscinibacter aquaticus]